MDIYTLIDIDRVGQTLRARLSSGQIGILPTDTIYGISGNALDGKVVKRILDLKGRQNPPSFVPHSLDFAELIVVDEQRRRFRREYTRFNGKYTMLFEYDDEFIVLPELIRSTGLVGLRFPEHWIRRFTAQLCLPLITTSVNRSGEPFMTSLDDLDPAIASAIDFCVYEGPSSSRPSTIVHCYQRPYRYEER